MLVAASVASMIDQFCMPSVRLLQEAGCTVHVACNFREGNTCSRARVKKLAGTLRETGVICHQWDCPRAVRPVKNCIKAYAQIRRLLKGQGIRWMHCHSPVGGALARMAAHREGIPCVYTAHGFHFYRGAPFANWLLYYPAEWFLSRFTDVLVTVNREDFRLAKRRLRAGRTCRIPGVGIDTRRFAPAETAGEAVQPAMPAGTGGPERSGEHACAGMSGAAAERDGFLLKYRIPADAVVLLSAGELNAGKNHRTAIAALAALKREDLYYLVCGQGALMEELREYADSLGVGERVRLAGYVQDMERVYRNADIFVFPSVREGMPVALMEAMAAGLPCVVSDIRGCRELVRGVRAAAGSGTDCPAYRGKGGFRFSLKHPQQLCTAVRLLSGSARLRRAYGAYNREKIKGYDISAVQEKMKRIYAFMQLQARGRDRLDKGGRDRKWKNKKTGKTGGNTT